MENKQRRAAAILLECKLHQARATACVYTRRHSVAVLFQSNFFACVVPAATSFRRNSGSVTSRVKAPLIDSTSSGFIVAAASPTTSASDPFSEEITGVPQAIASAGGIPETSV